MRRLLPLLLAALVMASAPAAQAMVEPASAKAQPQALFFGDSYFVGGGCSPDRSMDMAYLAGVALGYRPVVRGAGGTGFVGANAEYDIPAYLPQIADGALDARNPRLVVIEGGSNDIGFPVSKIKKNARKVLDIARGKYPEAKLILVGPLQTYGDFAQTDPIKVGLRQVAKKEGVPFVNMQRWTVGHDEWLCSDYVHPTYEGQVELGKRLTAALDRRGA